MQLKAFGSNAFDHGADAMNYQTQCRDSPQASRYEIDGIFQHAKKYFNKLYILE
jgi:hypothetical protein